MIVVVRVRIRTYIGSDDKQSLRETTGKFLYTFLVGFTSLLQIKRYHMKNTIILKYMVNTLHIHSGQLPTPHVPLITASPTVSVPILNDANKLDYFQLFLNTQLIEYIVECTNVYMPQPGSVRCLQVGGCCSGPATFDEINAFVG